MPAPLPRSPSPADPYDRPLRVAFDAGPLHGHQTGIGRAVAQLADALDRSGVVERRPFLISARATPLPGETRLPLPGMVAAQLWSRGSRPLADRWLGQVDVVHGTNYVAPPSRLPTVVSVYDCWFLAHPELANPIVARAGRWLRRTVERGAWVHCSSAATASQATQLLDTDRIRVIHLGPPALADQGDADHATSTKPSTTQDRSRVQGNFEIVAVGTEERRKGYPDLVQAFGLVAGEHDRVRLAIAGAPGDDSERIDAAVAGLPPSTQARIVRLGPISDADKTSLLKTASVLAYPSLDEGFGFPLLEANQYRVPIAARAAGSIPEVAGASALVVADGADFVADYANALTALLTDGDLAARLIDAGPANLDRFSWDRCAHELIELYQVAISTERGKRPKGTIR